MIYLDHNATTPVDAAVLQAMLPYFSQNFANPASRHGPGWQVAAAVKKSRETIAALIGSAHPDNIIFTSGTTESNNLAIRGLIAHFPKPAHIITQASEHSCVLASMQELESAGHSVTILPVDAQGQINIHELENSFQKNTALVSIMHANNEIGTIYPLAEIAEITHAHGALLHTDAAQSLGKIPFSVDELKIDLVSFSAHKMYGPKGMGALYVARHKNNCRLKPLFVGGGHEFGLRSGTLNVPGIIGLATALENALQKLSENVQHLNTLTTALLSQLQHNTPKIQLNGPEQNRLPGNLNLMIDGIAATDLITLLPNIAFSTGSACANHSTEPSHVLRAIGLSKIDAESSIRIGVGKDNTLAEVQTAATQLALGIADLRKSSLRWQMNNDKTPAKT